MNMPFSNLKNAFVALCYFCEATVLQIDNPYKKKCPVTLHITDVHCAQTVSLPSAIALNPPSILFFFFLSDRPRPAQPQSRAERTGGRS